MTFLNFFSSIFRFLISVFVKEKEINIQKSDYSFSYNYTLLTTLLAQLAEKEDSRKAMGKINCKTGQLKI